MLHEAHIIDFREMLMQEYSDVYKEENGIRPRWMYGTLNAMSTQELIEEVNNLFFAAEIEAERERVIEEANAKARQELDALVVYKPFTNLRSLLGAS